MMKFVKSFKELTPEHAKLAGGKGSMLAKMLQDGYPVPNGFIVLSSAFKGEKLLPEAWTEIQVYLQELRRKDADVRFAVRSSAMSEDSEQASFAGAFESVLDVETDDEVRSSIDTVYRSARTDRVREYTSVQGMDEGHEIAVVVQLMVQSKFSGVLFTADPITGSSSNMIGNFIYGLGEKLVLGEVDAESFTITRPKGTYNGPDEFKKYASKLYQYAATMEKDLGIPQDIEWAAADGKLYLLQARPITTLSTGDLDTYEINDSLAGEAIWVNTNVGEAVPDVMTPFSWSMIRMIDEESGFIPGYYVWSGNIGGRVYSNISQRLSVITAIANISPKRAMYMLGDLFGQIPEKMKIPLYPFNRIGFLKVMLPRIIYIAKKTIQASKHLPQYLKDNPDWCRAMGERIGNVQSKQELLALWNEELYPHNFKAWWSHAAGGTKAVLTSRLSSKLTKHVGIEDANALMSNLRGSSGLASLGPVIGVSKVRNGEMSREEYMMQYGHRGPHEFELSIPHPAEDADWLEDQMKEFTQSDNDVDELFQKQYSQFDDAVKRFNKLYPNKSEWLQKQLAKAADAARMREAVRSEFVRVFRVNRGFALKAGELTGIGEDVFFLYSDEVPNLLAGDETTLKFISIRKENYNKYKALPPLPSVIHGRFDPFLWAKDPNRRIDFYDPTISVENTDSETLKGCPGAAGRVEGTVRVLHHPEEANQLQPGEILVASTTNVGWTPLFPKAAAIITDIGAPLSHAAIVARELGIPAVVGCGNATTRLKTGDRAMVDGGQGVVTILNQE